MRSLRRRLIICLVLLPGCGSGTTSATGHVDGVVRLDGQPLPEGTVLFQNDDQGVGASTAIHDGQFAFEPELLAGEYRVAVRPPPLPAPHEAPRPPGTIVVWPDRYLRGETSGFTAIVKTGTNSFELDLQSGKQR